VKDASIRSLVFDTSLINPAYPNYDKIRSLVAAALAAPATSAASSSAPSSSAASSTSAAPSASATPSGAPPTTNPVANVKDACAYNPKEAAAALAAGEPPTKTHP
jgi:polyisoprenyl-teichoic acid--peptidoglycan teichoic acid transferase